MLHDLTPRPHAHEKNPFDFHPLLAATPNAGSPLPLSPAPAYGAADLTPLGTPAIASAQPTTHVSLHAPVFKMQQPPPAKLRPASPHTPTSKGQIHVKLIQARALNVPSVHARPYVVVQFEQNEFVSRDPIPESDKEVKGTPIVLSRQTSSNAVSALGAIGSKAAARRKNSSKDSSPSSSLVAAASKALNFSRTPPPASSGISGGL
ncbi:hypothetical protein CVT26_001696, partial [Gymnopilus dilepis]